MSSHAAKLIVDIGAAAWREVRPWRRMKIALNKRRARLGKPLLPLTEDDMNLLPNGTATHTGAAIAGSSPVVGLVVTMFVPAVEQKIAALGMAPLECTIEAMNCVTAGQLAFGLVSGIVAVAGGWLATWGRQRAEKRHAAALAAAQRGE